MPDTFLTVIGSLSINAAKIIAHKGILVVMIEASPGEVMLTPKINEP